MKNKSIVWNTAFALGAMALLVAPFAASPARAQDVPAAGAADNGKPISLNLINVPVQTALRTLFSSAGIRNYTIDPGVQGYANINVSDVPFSLALRQLLSSGNPPLTFEVVNGIYQVKVQQAVTAPQPKIDPTVDASGNPTSTADQPKRFYNIPIDSYDAFYIATLVGQTGIIEVIPNYPGGTAGQTGSQNGQNGQNGQGNRGGLGGGPAGGITSVGGGSGGFGSSSGFGSSGGFGGGGGRRGF